MDQTPEQCRTNAVIWLAPPFAMSNSPPAAPLIVTLLPASTVVIDAVPVAVVAKICMLLSFTDGPDVTRTPRCILPSTSAPVVPEFILMYSNWIPGISIACFRPDRVLVPVPPCETCSAPSVNHAAGALLVSVGCTWLYREYSFDVPGDAVPFISGDASDALDAIMF